MTYTAEQIEKTKKYIIDYFGSAIEIIPQTQEKFEGKLNKLFEELRLLNPVKFEFKKKNKNMKWLVLWCEKQGYHFPDNFKIFLFNDGTSLFYRYQSDKAEVIARGLGDITLHVVQNRDKYAKQILLKGYLPSLEQRGKTRCFTPKLRPESDSDSDSDDLIIKQKSMKV